MKMDSKNIASVNFKGKALINSSSVAQLNNGDELDVRIKGNVDRHRRIRGRCKSCKCDEYSRPSKGNDCDYCKHGPTQHKEANSLDDNKDSKCDLQ
jgi:hypothetical protein